MDPPQKKKSRKDAGDSAHQLRCDCCCNFIISEDNHIQNNPCNHSVCLTCFVKSNMNRVANPAYCQVRDCTQKYTISCQIYSRGIPGEIIENGTIVELGSDEVANILSFLPLKEIMPKRRVCKKWSEAVKNTIVSPSNDSDFVVNSMKKYNAMNVMTRALPNLQQISICYLGNRHRWSDGEDPDEERASSTAHRTSHDIEIISNFSKLRDLTIATGELLNGRYPFLFNSFPLLQKLNIYQCRFLKWDLEMLSGLPSLKELDCECNKRLTGNISSLRVLKDTLEKVVINQNSNIKGNFMDLADFPHLKELDLYETAVTGDIRDIDDNDFSSLECLDLPKGVYGGIGCEFRRISDAPDIVRTVYLFKKQRPALKMEGWHCVLSEDSLDWYDRADDDDGTPPLYIRFVEAGSRLGYRWENVDSTNPCEVNWLDPEPDRGSSDYEKYIGELQDIHGEVGMYQGFRQPPTEEEYNTLVALP